MSVTAQTIYNRAISLIDEIDSATGIPNVDGTDDYLANALYQLNCLQTELLSYSQTVQKYELSCKSFANLCSESFSLAYHDSDDVEKYAEAGGVKAYYFECDGAGTAYIEDFTSSWNILATVTLTEPTSGFTAYKGIVSPTTGATRTRIRFSGSYYYAFQNWALFGVSFSSSSKIPNYREWIKVTLPSTLYYIQNVIAETVSGIYADDSVYKIEEYGNLREFYYSYNFEGMIRIMYRAYPTTLTAMTDVLECDDATATAFVYGLALYFAQQDKDSDLYGILKVRFNEQKNILLVQKPLPAENITNVYGTF